jgi:general stress protein YciG
MAARAEAEAVRRWARYAEDVGPDEDEMPDVGADGEQDSDADEAEDPQVHTRGGRRSAGTSHWCPKVETAQSCPAEFLHTFVRSRPRNTRGQCMKVST